MTEHLVSLNDLGIDGEMQVWNGSPPGPKDLAHAFQRTGTPKIEEVGREIRADKLQLALIPDLLKLTTDDTLLSWIDKAETPFCGCSLGSLLPQIGREGISKSPTTSYFPTTFSYISWCWNDTKLLSQAQIVSIVSTSDIILKSARGKLPSWGA